MFTQRCKYTACTIIIPVWLNVLYLSHTFTMTYEEFCLYSMSNTSHIRHVVDVEKLKALFPGALDPGVSRLRRELDPSFSAEPR